ncbi:Uncharacterized conserved protein, DUF983 family [Gemmobacter megaterium]|uniref:Uncharacterized conserved protein, DUF983 family n=1 Tax=Gemmobacter megaterium TaxID=1086013 RepID=A0A1N7P9V6_9RHOB|nr:DUF983 domain-containing protein [Gemmobacter megaterium]SIT07374.1 Uncharacterized conserved protein, DUF983 family [Gemmobacter megaterium]
MTSTAQAAPMEILDDDRPMRPAMLRGWRRRCPACGSGPMLQGYLKVRDHCPVCDEALHHHRADDGPAYLTIVVVGKLLTPLIFWVFTAFRPEPLVMAVAFSIAAVALSLYLLPRLKGMLVAIQWSRRMHGFGPSAD